MFLKQAENYQIWKEKLKRGDISTQEKIVVRLVRVKGLARLWTGGGAFWLAGDKSFITRPSSPFPLPKKKVTTTKPCWLFWCGWKDLNLHEVAPTRTWILRVCQFRHTRMLVCPHFTEQIIFYHSFCHLSSLFAPFICRLGKIKNTSSKCLSNLPLCGIIIMW